MKIRNFGESRDYGEFREQIAQVLNDDLRASKETLFASIGCVLDPRQAHTVSCRFTSSSHTQSIRPPDVPCSKFQSLGHQEQLLQGVWGDTFVEEVNLTRYVSHLRKALDDDADDINGLSPLLGRDISSLLLSTVTGAGDNEKRAAIHVATSETSQTAKDADIEDQAGEAIPKLDRYWRKVSAVVASTVTLSAIASLEPGNPAYIR